MPSIITRGNIPPRITPIRTVLGGGGGSFFEPPFVLYDALYEPVFGQGSQPLLRFINSGTFDIREDDGIVRAVQTVPLQWWHLLPVAPASPGLYSVRLLLDEGPNFWNGPSGRPAEGEWRALNLNLTSWDILAFPKGQIRENTSTFELALTADLIPKARATITLSCTRPL